MEHSDDKDYYYQLKMSEKIKLRQLRPSAMPTSYQYYSATKQEISPPMPALGTPRCTLGGVKNAETTSI